MNPINLSARPTHRRLATFVAALLALSGATGLAIPAASAGTSPVNGAGILQFLAGSVCSDGDVFQVTAPIAGPTTGVVFSCSATLDLNGHPTALQSIDIAAGETLTITDSSVAQTGQLTVDPSAVYGTAGIRTAVGSLVVNAGTVIAKGGTSAAGIGGNPGSTGQSGGNVTINGTAIVTSTGGGGAPGIGGGAGTGANSDGGSGGTVTIGGTAKVTAIGLQGGTGIGGGSASDAGGAGAQVTVGQHTQVTAYTGVNGLSAIGAGSGGTGSATGGFGHLTVAGTLRLPSGYISILDGTGDEVEVTSTGLITGSNDDEPSEASVTGNGQIDNAGTITLATSKVTADEVQVKDHHYKFSFDTQGGSAAPNDVTVYSESFDNGWRILPSPTKVGSTFGGWYTEADGGGTQIGAGTILAGSSTDGTPVTSTLYAKWSSPAPTLTGDPTATGQVGTAFAYTPTLDASSGTTVTSTGDALPDGLTLNSTTGAITGTPAAGSGGTYELTLTADNDVEPNATLDVTVTINEAPSITGASTATAVVGQAFEYTPTTLSGSPAPTITLIDSDMPEGLSLNASTGKISGTPIGSGTFPMILKASNGIGTPATLEFTIAINRVPTLTGASTANGQTGQAFSYLPTSFFGTPHPTATVSAGDLPDGLSLTASTGKISGIPTETGTFPITLTASNGIGTAPTLDVTITIATSPITGLAPTITGTVREGATLTASPGAVVPPAATLTHQWMANGTNISGATGPTLKLGKAQAGRKIAVTITANAPGYDPQTATSASTGLVSSPYARIVLTTYTVKKGQVFGLVATGLKPGQKYGVWLGGKKTNSGTADANGTVSRTAKFPSSIKPGTRRVRVSGYNSKNKRTFTVLTRVTYKK